MHKEGGKKMSTRKPLFSPSCLPIMCTKITQLGMTSCQISLAAMHLFLAFSFLKQSSEVRVPEIKKSLRSIQKNAGKRGKTT